MEIAGEKSIIFQGHSIIGCHMRKKVSVWK